MRDDTLQVALIANNRAKSLKGLYTVSFPVLW
jgi:hypothetical protein